ncbi:uncharacterized protein LOC123514882 [Portunus trituberculatus]|uniref:uncharacterized protein LOC123514882 n=1 Tax=Portunus trituberculatus TaxID=210409 RepID=UPI001E1D0E94|nr:uncharacterized protein LOC123514882 [Portunus trituberculatus]
MALVSAVLHRQGIRLIRYLDDWLLLASSKQEALRSRAALLHLCEAVNISINRGKLEFKPTQTINFLGMEIHSTILKVFPSQDRVTQLLETIEYFGSWPCPPAQVWLVLLGHLSSLTQLVPGGRRRMKSLQFQLSNCWNRQMNTSSHPVPLSLAVLEDLQWWSDVGNLLQGHSLEIQNPELFLYTDASLEGWDASILDAAASGTWPLRDQGEHITLLELRVIRLGLQAFEEVLQGRTVAILSDNTTAISYIKKAGGTRSVKLNQEAQQTLLWAENKNVTILTHRWLDLFATRLNYRLPNFVSPFYDPMAVATDVFLFSWDNMELYAFPPFHVIWRVINKLRSSTGTKLVQIAPFWPQREWFPDLVELPNESLRMPFDEDCYENGRLVWRLFVPT